MTNETSAVQDDTALRVALIGTGRVADHRLAPAISKIEGLRLCRVYGEDYELAKLFATRHELPLRPDATAAVAQSIEELVQDPDIDLVMIESSDRQRFSAAQLALQEQKHCWVQAPATHSPEELDHLMGAAAAQDLSFRIGDPLRFSRPHQLIAEEIAQQKLGDLYRLSIHWAQTPGHDRRAWGNDPQRAAWGVGASLGMHALDLLSFFIPFSPHEVLERQSLSLRERSSPHFDHELNASFRLPSGTLIDLRLSQRYNAASRLEFFGSRSNLIAENTLSMEGRGEVVDSERGSLSYDRIDPYQSAIQHWAKGICKSQTRIDARSRYRDQLLLLWDLLEPLSAKPVDSGINSKLEPDPS